MIKRHYPHGIHRRARNGCPIWIERRMDLPAVREGGVSLEALRRHYLFVTEYLWRVVEPDFDRGQVVTVLDVAGLGLRDLAGEAVGFVKVQKCMFLSTFSSSVITCGVCKNDALECICFNKRSPLADIMAVVVVNVHN